MAVRTEIANNLMNVSRLLTPSTRSNTVVERLSDVQSTSGTVRKDSLASSAQTAVTQKTTESLRTVDFWLSVAALSVLTNSSWIELSPSWRNLRVSSEIV